jgi:hypothetical protein
LLPNRRLVGQPDQLPESRGDHPFARPGVDQGLSPHERGAADRSRGDRLSVPAVAGKEGAQTEVPGLSAVREAVGLADGELSSAGTSRGPSDRASSPLSLLACASTARSASTRAAGGKLIGGFPDAA